MIAPSITSPRSLELRRKLLGDQFVPLSEASYQDRVSSCRVCPLYQKQTCGLPRQPFDLDRDESVLGSGLPLAKRQTRVECACPLGRWDGFGGIAQSSAKAAVFSSGFETANRSSLLLAKQLGLQFEQAVTIVNERTPYVCLQPKTAPLYAFDLFPEAEYVAYVGPEVFFFERSDFPNLDGLDRNGLYALRLPSPYESYYDGLFIAHRSLRVLFELAKEQLPGGLVDVRVRGGVEGRSPDRTSRTGHLPSNAREDARVGTASAQPEWHSARRPRAPAGADVRLAETVA